jgi:membrane protease YdiL (CAAX protease family)
MPIKYIETKTKSKFSRRDILIVFSALLVIIVSLIFPQAAYGETFWLSLFLFAAFPGIVIINILKEPLANFGLSWGKPKVGTISAIIALIIFILGEYFLLYHTKYGGQLTIARFVIGSFFAFVVFEIFIALPLHFFWEFFFRGFVQLGLEKKLGIFSLLIAAILQTVLSFRLNWVMILLIFISSLAGGLIVRQSRSIIYSAAFMWLISVSLDIMVIRIAHQLAR